MACSSYTVSGLVKAGETVTTSLPKQISEQGEENSGVMAILRLRCGDVEKNPGPPVFFNPIKISRFLSAYPDISPEEVYSEYLMFLRNLNVNMLPNIKSDLIRNVRNELGIEIIMNNMGKLNLEKLHHISKGKQLLEELGIFLGKSLSFLCPPLLHCILCQKLLTKNNKPTQVVIHSVTGPQMFKKNTSIGAMAAKCQKVN